MAQDIEVDININSNTEATIANLRALRRQLRETAAGSEEFNRLSAQIRDMDDAIRDASATSDDFLGYLENASGPLGVLGRGIRGAEQTFSSFNGVLKASVIGIITLAIGGLVAAFSKSETAMKKLEPVFAAFDKILQGIMKVFEPLLDAFIDLALRALPYIAKGIGGFYSGLFALFTLVKNVGVGAGKILKGIFTLDFDALKEGYGQLTGSWNAAVDEFKESNKRFLAGSNEVTKVEKKNSATRVASHKKEVKEKTKENETYLDSYTQSLIDELFAYEAHQKKILELEKQYATKLEDLEADSDQQKLDLWYKRQKAEIDAIAETEKEKANLYALLNKEKAIKQKQIDDKTQEEADKIKKDQAAKKKAEDDKEWGNLTNIDLQKQIEEYDANGGLKVDPSTGLATNYFNIKSMDKYYDVFGELNKILKDTPIFKSTVEGGLEKTNSYRLRSTTVGKEIRSLNDLTNDARSILENTPHLKAVIDKQTELLTYVDSKQTIKTPDGNIISGLEARGLKNNSYIDNQVTQIDKTIKELSSKLNTKASQNNQNIRASIENLETYKNNLKQSKLSKDQLTDFEAVKNSTKDLPYLSVSILSVFPLLTSEVFAPL